MKWSLGSTALLLTMAAGAPVWAAEPAPPTFAPPSARPAIFSGKLGLGFLSGNHVRPVSTGTAAGEVVAGEPYLGHGDIDGGHTFGPGSCDYQAPCVNHLWDGYSQRPKRCLLGQHAHGCKACGAANQCGGRAYSGLFSGKGCNRGCETCDSGCDKGCDQSCDGGCGGGFRNSGLGRFWASCFGGSCGDEGADCGCSDTISGANGQHPTPTPTLIPETHKGLELDEDPVPPAPTPDPDTTKEAKRRTPTTLRGFGSFGLK